MTRFAVLGRRRADSPSRTLPKAATAASIVAVVAIFVSVTAKMRVPVERIIERKVLPVALAAVALLRMPPRSD